VKYRTGKFRLEKVQSFRVVEIDSRSIAPATDMEETIFSILNEVFSLFFMQQNRVEVPV
jgi:hypothetical protein